MTDAQKFVAQVVARLSPICPVTSRAMFGGYGLFADGVIFALIAYDTLYFKVDDGNRGDYIESGMPPFSYMGKHKPIQMSYYQVPETVWADLEILVVWVEHAIAAGRRAKSKQKKSKPKP
jgi:DNA transformation protein and related proteins